MKITIITIITFTFRLAFAQLNESQHSFLQQMVEINSSTENTKGLNELGELITKEFSVRGLVVNKINVTPNQPGSRFVYQIRKPTSNNKITLIGHIDTVFSSDSNFKKIKSNGQHIIGPGVIDMKGGILLMRELALGLPDSALDQLQILLNDDEEIGSIYSKNIVRNLLVSNSSVLIMEPGLPDGSVVTSQGGVAWYELSVYGKSAHAGLEPEKGFSACTELAYKITKISELSNLKNNINLNPGVISGGSKANIVCEQAISKIDVRFKELNQLETLDSLLQTITSQIFSQHLPLKFAPRMNLKKLAFLPPLSEDRTNVLFGMLKQIEGSVGLEINGTHVGYGSDGNNISDLPLNILVGLGPFGGGMHTENEFMDIKSFSQRYLLNLALINKLIKTN